MDPTPLGELAKALAQAQAAFPLIPKDKVVRTPQYSYAYADLATILQCVRGPLAQNQLALTQKLDYHEGFVVVTTMLLHAAGGSLESALAMPAPLKATPQALGSAITYARRYGLTALLGVAADDDDDGGEAEREVRQQPARQYQPNSRQVVANASGPSPVSHPGRETAVGTPPPSLPPPAVSSPQKLPLKARVAERARQVRDDDGEFTAPGGAPMTPAPAEREDPRDELEAQARLDDERARHGMIERVLNAITALVPRNGNKQAREGQICTLIQECFGFQPEHGELRQLGQILDALPARPLRDGLAKLERKLKEAVGQEIKP